MLNPRSTFNLRDPYCTAVCGMRYRTLRYAVRYRTANCYTVRYGMRYRTAMAYRTARHILLYTIPHTAYRELFWPKLPALGRFPNKRESPTLGVLYLNSGSIQKIYTFTHKLADPTIGVAPHSFHGRMMGFIGNSSGCRIVQAIVVPVQPGCWSGYLWQLAPGKWSSR